MFSNLKVSIGIPIHNGAKTLKCALNSLVNQTHKNIEIIISDNNSSDDTFKICSKYAETDKRIMLFKQNLTLSPIENFKFVFDQSSGEYFMWAAADDTRSHNTIEDCLSTIINNHKCVAATNMEFLGKSNGNNIEMVGTVFERAKLFLKKSDSYGLVYSLTKTSLIKDFKFPKKTFYATDWVYICYLIKYGEIRRSSKSETYFGENGLSNGNKRYSFFRNNLLDWILPLRKASKSILFLFKDLSKEEQVVLRKQLAIINFNTAVGQFSFERNISQRPFIKFLLYKLELLFQKHKILYLKLCYKL